MNLQKLISCRMIALQEKCLLKSRFGSKVVTYYFTKGVFLLEMGRPKELQDSVRLSVALSKAQAMRLKKIAIRMSNNLDRQVTVSEVLRLAAEAYPMPDKS